MEICLYQIKGVVFIIYINYLYIIFYLLLEIETTFLNEFCRRNLLLHRQQNRL